MYRSTIFPKSANAGRGSEPTAAGGGRKEASEWQRSADDAAASAARKMPGTATGPAMNPGDPLPKSANAGREVSSLPAFYNGIFYTIRNQTSR